MVIENSKLLHKEESDLVIEPNGSYLGGTLRSKEGHNFFYRDNDRYVETIAGYFGKKYGFGMDTCILQHMWKYPEDYDSIYIETEFNLWAISYGDFLSKSISSARQYFYICSEEHFNQTKKYDDSLPANERNYNNDPIIKREADYVNQQAKKNGTEAKGKKETKSKKKETATEETDGGGNEEASMDNESDSNIEGEPEKENPEEDSKEETESVKPGAQRSLF